MRNNVLKKSILKGRKVCEKAKRRNGITLIALIVTIIVLLILAGVTIATLTGENGLITKAQQAALESKYAGAAEKVALAVNASYDTTGKLNDSYLKDNLNRIDGIKEPVETVEYDLKVVVDGFEFTISEFGIITGKKDFVIADLPENTPQNPQDAGKEVALKDGWGMQHVTYVKTSDGTEVKTLETVATVYAISVGGGETVPIPGDGKTEGFYYVGGTLDTGVIISDNVADKYDGKVDKTTHEYAPQLKGNQFVWIPCSIKNYKKIDFGKENAKWDKETNTAEYTQIQKYGGFYIGRYEAGVSTLNETTGTFTDSVTFNNSASLFNSVSIQTGINSWGRQNYNFIARGNLVTDSNYQNKATGNIVEKANSIPYYHADYYTAVEMSRRLYNNNYVNSGLVTGTQWDMMMKYISDQSDYSDVKSTSWGNYNDTSLTGLRGYYTNVTSAGATDGFKNVSSSTEGLANSGTRKSGYSYVLLTTGSTEQVLKKGLYDVAGNLWEWSQEASYRDDLDYNMNITYNSYVLRGGSYRNAFSVYPVCDRVYDSAPNTNTNFRL